MALSDLISPDLIFTDLGATADREEVLRSLADRLVEHGSISDGEALLTRLLEREELGSTGIGHGVAIPHAKMEDLDHVVVALGIATTAVDFGALDGEPVEVFFVVVSPEKEPAAHLRALSAISRWVKEHPRPAPLLRGSRFEVHRRLASLGAAAS